MKKLLRWFRYGNDCEHCPYGWCKRTSYEYDEWDGGCYIKGDDWQDEPCRLLPPYKNIIGFFKKRKAMYFENHYYDNYPEYCQHSESLDEKLKELIDKYMLRYGLYYKLGEGEYTKVENCDMFYNFWRIRSEYEDFAHPFVYKSIRTEWKELICKTFNAFVDKFKPYFCE